MAKPVLDSSAAPSFIAISEGSGSPSGAVGTLVSQLINSGGVFDNYSETDGDSPAIAIVGKNLNGGTLHFSIDNGVNWQEVIEVSENSATVLYADSNTRIYYSPATDFAGSISDVITFRAWDRTGTAVNGQSSVDLRQGPISGNFLDGLDDTSQHPNNYAIAISQDSRVAYSLNHGQLKIVDITDPSNLKLLALKTGIGGNRIALSADGNYIHTGRHIVDVSSINPWDGISTLPYNESNVTIVSDLEASIPNTSRKSHHKQNNDIVLRTVDGKNYAYVLDYYTGLVIFDISDVNNPIFKGAHSIRHQSELDVSSDGRTAYIVGGAVHQPGKITIVDVSDLSSTYIENNPSKVPYGIKELFSSTTVTKEISNTGGAFAITLSDDENFAYVGTDRSGGGLYIVDLLTSNSVFLNTTGGAVREITLSADGNTAYVSADWGGVDIVDVTNKNNPYVIKNVKNANKYNKANAITPDQNTLLIGHHGATLESFDMAGVLFFLIILTLSRS